MLWKRISCPQCNKRVVYLTVKESFPHILGDCQISATVVSVCRNKNSIHVSISGYASHS